MVGRPHEVEGGWRSGGEEYSDGEGSSSNRSEREGFFILFFLGGPHKRRGQKVTWRYPVSSQRIQNHSNESKPVRGLIPGPDG